VQHLIPLFLAFGGVLLLVGGVLVVSLRLEKQRIAALTAASQAMGFTFEPDGDLEVMKGFGDLPLYGHGHSKQVRNVMTGRAGERDVKLFDYRYTTGGGKSSHTWNQTVALFPQGGGGLPDLILAPENILHKIGKVFGYGDIDFDSSPDFSSHYLLRGPNEMAIRSAFGADALVYFGQQRGWHVEVAGGNVGIYRSGQRCKPEELLAFLEQATAALRALAHG
jgi:hypothetical protein